MVVEKSDVDIAKLFHFGEKYIIKDKSDKKLMEVFIRLVGDEDLNKARVFAIRKSADLRKELKDKDSDIYLAYMPDFSDLSNDSLVSMYIGLSLGRLTREAIKNIDLPYPKEIDSDASLEEQEKYQKEVDEYPQKRNDLIQIELDKLIKKERESLVNLSKEELSKVYELGLVNELCEQEMLTRFREICVYFGTFKDKEYNRRVFKSFDEFANLPPFIKDQLINFYMALEIGVEELKK